MRILNLLNGPEGCQIGIEDGFNHLKKTGKISFLKNLYFGDSIKKNKLNRTIEEIHEIIQECKINLLVIYHLPRIDIDINFFSSLKKINKDLIVVYDDHDGYEKFRKPFPKIVKLAMKEADLVSLCGLGSIVKMLRKKDRRKIIYTPHQVSIQKHDTAWDPCAKRKYDVVMIGNRLTSRIPFKRLSGASDREAVVRLLGGAFGDRFAIYGQGWEGFVGNKGPLPFEKQIEAIREGIVTVGVDHCQSMTHYFSDRLPISMFSGVPHICQYRTGYEDHFKEGEDLLYFYFPKDVVQVVMNALSMGENYLIDLGLSGRKKAIESLSPEVVWGNFIDAVVERFPYLENN